MEIEFNIWYKEWRAKLLKDMWWLYVPIDKQFKEGNFIYVAAFPIKEDKIPLCMLKEPLTKSNAKQLKTALNIIEKMQGIKIDQSISFMMQVVIMFKDYYRAKKKEKSIFEGLQRGDIPESKITEILERAKPMFSLKEVLYDWHEKGGRLSGGFMKKPTGFIGVPQYTTIPPGWIKIDDYKEVFGEGDQLPKIATTLDPLELQLLPLLKGLSEYTAFNAGRKPVRENEHEATKPKMVQEKQKKQSRRILKQEPPAAIKPRYFSSIAQMRNSIIREHNLSETSAISETAIKEYLSDRNRAGRAKNPKTGLSAIWVHPSAMNHPTGWKTSRLPK